MQSYSEDVLRSIEKAFDEAESTLITCTNDYDIGKANIFCA